MKKLVLTTLILVSSLSAEEHRGPLGVLYAEPSQMNQKYFPKKNDTYNINFAEKGNYQVFVSKLGNFDIANATGKEIFFGENSEYQKLTVKEIAANATVGVTTVLQANSGALLSTGAEIAQSLSVGLGGGLLVAGLDNVVNYLRKDTEYVKVIRYTDKNGKTGKITTLFVCDDNEYKEAEIRSFMALKEGI